MALLFNKENEISVVGYDNLICITDNTLEISVVITARQFEEICNHSKSIIEESRQSVRFGND